MNSFNLEQYLPCDKYMADFVVIESVQLGSRYTLLSLQIKDQADNKTNSVPLPGQFVQVQIKGVDGVMLRRPISVHDYDYTTNTLKLLIARAGRGTEVLCKSQPGDTYNLLLPLGNTFPLKAYNLKSKRIILIGGGVGMAPLLYYGRWLKECGADIEFIQAAKTKSDIIMNDVFTAVAPTTVCTDDGTQGVHGFATDTETLMSCQADMWMVCGPTPMMRAVAALARKRGIICFASLENMMACGLGACLCCVHKTADGHNRCVCTQGPVFETTTLGW